MSVVFDLDATLVDSQQATANSIIAACEQIHFGGPAPVPEFFRLSGTPLEEVVRILQLPNEFINAYRAVARETLPSLSLFAGVADMLNMLRRQGTRLGIFTGKDRAKTIETLEILKLREFFSAIVTPDDVVASKPAPDGLFAIADQWGIPSSDLTMIGDSELDMQAGLAATCRTIGCTWGVASAQALRKSGANRIVRSVRELELLLANAPGR